MRRLPLAALAVLLCSCAAGPSTPAGATALPRGFLGVDADRSAVDGTVPLDAQVARMRSIGVETVGVSFNWSAAQPTAESPYDFTASDRLVLTAAKHGIGVYPVVIHAPVWARLHPDLDFSPPKDPEQYAAYAGALVARYGSTGTFWKAHPEIAARPIRDWQVWNEPAGSDFDNSRSVFWQDDAPFQPRYVALLRAAHAAIKRADPHARVVLASLIGQSWRTLDTLYAAHARSLFDVVSLHPYTNDAPNVMRIVRYVRKTMQRRGDARKPVLLTEVGWPAFDAKGVVKLGRARAAKVQAGWLRSVFRDVVAHRRQYRIEKMLWYTWLGRDRSSTDAFDHTGLNRLEPDGKVLAKPALASFRALARAWHTGAYRRR